MKPDHLKKYIKEILLPVVAEEGSSLYKPKDLVRLKGQFVDCLGFQLSQYGSKQFYVHYRKNLVADPFLNMNSYTVGYRMSNNKENLDVTEWCGQEEAQAKLAIESVVNAFHKTIKPWFDTVSTIPDYFFESACINQPAGFNRFNDAIAFACAGKIDRAWWICSDILEGDDLSEEDKETVRRRKEYCQMLSDANDADTQLEFFNPGARGTKVNELLEEWKNENIKRLKLPQSID